MTNNLTPKPETNLELWQEVLSVAHAETVAELGYDIPLSKLQTSPENIPDSQAVEHFESVLFDKAIAEWVQTIENSRRILGIVIELQQRRAMAWMNLKTTKDIADVGLKITDSMPDNSTKRQIQSLYRNYLPALDRAGVEPKDINMLMAESDRKILDTTRAIARVEKSDKDELEKNEQIKEIISDALTLPHASDLRRKWINGIIKVPLDEYTTKDGTRLLTFVCSDDEQAHEVRKHTDKIIVQYGNALPILDEYKNERITSNVLTDLQCVLAIIQSGDLDAVSTSRQVDILNVLKEYGILERTLNDNQS